jgi:hypothetical protein
VAGKPEDLAGKRRGFGRCKGRKRRRRQTPFVAGTKDLAGKRRGFGRYKGKKEAEADPVRGRQA